MDMFTDPNLIHVDWERTFEAITLIIIFAFIVERALAVIFENHLYIKHFDRDGLKELIVVPVAAEEAANGARAAVERLKGEDK